MLKSSCRIDVAECDDVRAFGEVEEDLRVAKTYFGRCLVCHDDIKNDMLGRGLVVQRIGKRRMGATLRAALQSGDAVGSLVNVLMVVGRSVRSMPLWMVDESQEVDCAVQHMPWTLPWALPCDSGDVFNSKAPPWCYLGGNERVKDSLGGADARVHSRYVVGR